MRRVQVVARVEKPASEVYPAICDFRRYPEQSSAVLAVDVRSLDGARHGCSWEVRFRRGILRWSEEDVFDDEKRRVAFQLIEGDVDHLRGCWEVDEEDAGSRVRFWAEFDMGIPTLAHPTPGCLDSLGKAGTFLDRDDPDAWVAEIRRLDDAALYARRSAAALARSKQLDPLPQIAALEHALREVAV